LHGHLLLGHHARLRQQAAQGAAPGMSGRRRP
jgi:hypothetical protein